MFTAWVTGLQPAAFNRFAYLTLARLRSAPRAGVEPATAGLTIPWTTTVLPRSRTRFAFVIHTPVVKDQKLRTGPAFAGPVLRLVGTLSIYKLEDPAAPAIAKGVVLRGQ